MSRRKRCYRCGREVARHVLDGLRYCRDCQLDVLDGASVDDLLDVTLDVRPFGEQLPLFVEVKS